MIVTCPRCRERHLMSAGHGSTEKLCRCGERLDARLGEPFFPEIIRCANCGGSAHQSLSHCAYCGAAFQPFSKTCYCAECHAFLPANAKFCSWCGSEALNPLELGNSGAAIQCPRDGMTLDRISLGNRPADKCQQCGGLWISLPVFQELKNDAEEALQHVEDPLGKSGASFETQVKYAKCPECQALMHRSNYAKRSGIIIDTCPTHGAWLDRDELRRLLQFIKDGGLHESKVRELEERVNQAQMSARQMGSAPDADEVRLGLAMELMRLRSRKF